jgi:hypothetical protein
MCSSLLGGHGIPLGNLTTFWRILIPSFEVQAVQEEGFGLFDPTSKDTKICRNSGTNQSTQCIGQEEVTSQFCLGIEDSANNKLY